MQLERNEYGIYQHNFTHYRGDSFEEHIVIQGMNIDNVTFKMHIVPSGDVDKLVPIIEKTSNGIKIILTPEQTRDLTWGQAQYDLQTEENGIVKTILKGAFKLIKDVTQ